MTPPTPCPNCGLHLAGIAGICPRCGCRFGPRAEPATWARRVGALAIGAGATMMLTGGYWILQRVLSAPADRGYTTVMLLWSVPTVLAGAVLIIVARTRSAELTRSGWVIAGRVVLVVLGLSLALAGELLCLLTVLFYSPSPHPLGSVLELDCVMIVAAGVGLCVRALGATGSWRRLPSRASSPQGDRASPRRTGHGCRWAVPPAPWGQTAVQAEESAPDGTPVPPARTPPVVRGG